MERGDGPTGQGERREGAGGRREGAGERSGDGGVDPPGMEAAAMSMEVGHEAAQRQ